MLQLENIPLAELHISKLNMRHSRKKPFVEDILPSIRTKGLRQPLLVRKEGKGYGVVAGRRRWFSLTQVQKEQDTPVDVPCAIMADGDDAEAMEASLLENLARLDPDEMQQFVAFKALADQGREVAEIADLFGITKLTVKRRLAIGNLLPEIRQLYQEDAFRSQTLTALTLASERQQKEWLKLWHDEDMAAPHGSQLKAWILGGGEIEISHALFDMKFYEGEIYEDLFGERAVFADAEMFWVRQNEEVSVLRQKFLDNGWAKVTILERGKYFQQWEYLKASKKEQGGIFIEVRHSGEVVIHKGFKKPVRAASTEKGTVKSELSKPLENYLDLHRHGAVRAKLLTDTGMALRLLAAHLIVGSDLLAACPDPQRAAKEEIGESVAASPAQQVFRKHRDEISRLLDLNTDEPVSGGNGDKWYLCQIFTKCVALSDADINRILCFIMVESLQVGHLATDFLGTLLDVDMGANWTPDDIFFELLRDKQVVTAVLADVAGSKTADANAGETTKTQKKILADCLSGREGRDPMPGWTPKWMQFPSQSYLPDRRSNLAERASQLEAMQSKE